MFHVVDVCLITRPFSFVNQYYVIHDSASAAGTGTELFPAFKEFIDERVLDCDVAAQQQYEPSHAPWTSLPKFDSWRKRLFLNMVTFM
jgi:hypothetical protein